MIYVPGRTGAFMNYHSADLKATYAFPIQNHRHGERTGTQVSMTELRTKLGVAILEDGPFGKVRMKADSCDGRG